MGQPNTDYSLLNRASISYGYLHTNSTTHEFLFGAIAELVDNARDAHANSLFIDFENDQLSFLDDGCGMDNHELLSIISFGHSTKRMDPNMVGQYGNGLKSGAMRIAKDFILFTKKDELLSCMLLSRTFHEKNKLKEVIVPSPSFLSNGDGYYQTDQEMLKYETEMEIILNYSPFRNQNELMKQFSRIRGENGTLVICYNLRRIEGGHFEMDFANDPKDIRMSEQLPHREEEWNSLRAYLSVLYANPRMRVFLRGEKVLTKRILSTLFKPRVYLYQAKNLKACAEKELKNCVSKVAELKDRSAMAKSELEEFKQKNPKYMANAPQRMTFRMLTKEVETLESDIRSADARSTALKKTRASPNPLKFYFGLNIFHRDRYGCMVYNNGRLIRMYEKVAHQKEKIDSMMEYLGVLAVVDIPFSVLEPTHNKQSFENAREYMNVLRAVNDHMEQYWIDIGIGAKPGGVGGFWRAFGYESNAWDATASDKVEFVRKRFIDVGISVQCDDCLKWRHLEYQPKFLNESIPKNWCCSMHPDSLFRKCSKLEELPRIPEGRLMRLPDKPPALGRGNAKLESTRASASHASPAKLVPKARKKLRSPSPLCPPVRANLSRAVKQKARRVRDMSDEEESDSEVDEAPPPTNRRQASASSARTAADIRRPAAASGTLAPTKRAGVPAKPSSRTPAAITKAVTSRKVDVRLEPSSGSEVSEESDSASGGGKAAIARTKASLREERDMKPAAGNLVRQVGLRQLKQESNMSTPSDQTPSPSKRRRTEAVSSRSAPVNDPDLECLGSSAEVDVTPAAASEATMSEEQEARGGLAEKVEQLFQQYKKVVDFFMPHFTEITRFTTVDEAIRFDTEAFFAAHRQSLQELIQSKVDERMQPLMASTIKLLEWADPQEADSLTEENLLERLQDFFEINELNDHQT